MKKNWLYGLLVILTLCSLWFAFRPKNRIVEVPLVFTRAGIPALNVIIGEKTYLVAIDSGSKLCISLNNRILDVIEKKERGTQEWRDLKGNHYSVPLYELGNVMIGKKAFEKILAVAEHSDAKKNTDLWNYAKNEDPNKTVGSIGRPLLAQGKFLFHFPKARVSIANDLNEFNRTKIFPENMISIPVELNNKGMFLNVLTDFGFLKLGIDTGASVSIIRSSILEKHERKKELHGYSLFKTTQFVIGEHDYGTRDLLSFDISPELKDLDGILGMDFLSEHVVYMDYANGALFIDF